MATDVMAAMVAWFVLSFPVAVVVGSVLGGGSRIRVGRRTNRRRVGSLHHA